MTLTNMARSQRVFRFEYDDPPLSFLVTERVYDEMPRGFVPTPDRIIDVGEYLIADTDPSLCRPSSFRRDGPTDHPTEGTHGSPQPTLTPEP